MDYKKVAGRVGDGPGRDQNMLRRSLMPKNYLLVGLENWLRSEEMILNKPSGMGYKVSFTSEL